MGHKDKALRLLYCRRADEHSHHPCHLRWLCPECRRVEQWANKIDAAVCASFALTLDANVRVYFVTLVIPPMEDPALQADILRTILKRLSRVRTGSWGVVEGMHWYIEPDRAANGSYRLHLHGVAYAANDGVAQLNAAEPRKARWHHIMLRCKMRDVAKKVLAESNIGVSDAHETRLVRISPLGAHVGGWAFGAERLDELEPLDTRLVNPEDLVAAAARIAEYAWAADKKKNRSAPTLSLDQQVALQLADLGKLKGRNGVFHNLPGMGSRREGERADLMLARSRLGAAGSSKS